MAKISDTTVGYLLGESENKDLLKDPAMLKRLNEIEKMDNEDKAHILHVPDSLIKPVKLKNIAALIQKPGPGFVIIQKQLSILMLPSLLLYNQVF